MSAPVARVCIVCIVHTFWGCPKSGHPLAVHQHLPEWDSHPPTPPAALTQRLHPSSDDQIKSRSDTYLRWIERWEITHIGTRFKYWCGCCFILQFSSVLKKEDEMKCRVKKCEVLVRLWSETLTCKQKAKAQIYDMINMNNGISSIKIGNI